MKQQIWVLSTTIKIENEVWPSVKNDWELFTSFEQLFNADICAVFSNEIKDLG